MKLLKYVFSIMIITLLLVSLVGCNKGQVNTLPLASFTDPDFKGKAFHKIMIVTPFKEINYRTPSEEIFETEFDRTNIKCVPSIDLLYPTRTYKDEEITVLLKKNNIDGILQISITGSKTQQKYIPPTAITTGSGIVEGNSVSIIADTDILGGYYDSKTFIRLEIKLIDVESNRVAWIAGTETTSAALESFEKAVGYLADEVIKQLQSDGLLTITINDKNKR